jgi:hypothetical protein
MELMLEDALAGDGARKPWTSAFASARLPDGAGTARLIGTMMPRVIVASPDVLQTRHGTPASARRARRRIASSAVPQARRRRPGNSNATANSVCGRRAPAAFTTNDTAGAIWRRPPAVWASRRRRRGPVRLEVASGALVQLLPGWNMAVLPVHAYFPLGRATRMAARAFVDFIAADIRRDPPSALKARADTAKQ